jgi:hypothetical protein
MTNEIQITRPLIRRFKDEDRIRNASIEVAPAEVHVGGDEFVEGFSIVQSHECWTGHEWLPIVNRDEAFTAEDAVKIARDMRDGLGLDPIGRFKVVAVDRLDGPLFEEISEEGDLYHFYHVATAVTLEDGRRFVHDYQPAGFGAAEAAADFAAKVEARGSVDLSKGWTEIAEGPSLEERLGAYGIEWELEARDRFEATGRYLPA